MQTIHIWGAYTPRTLRPYWALVATGLPFECHPVRTRTEDMETDDFLKLSPGKKIPVMQHGELIIAESAAITDYILRLGGRNDFDVETQAHIEHWSSFVLTEIDATALYVLRRHEGLPQIYGEAPAAVSSARAYFERQIKVINNYLEEGQRFLVANTLTKADIFLVSCCAWAGFVKLALPARVDGYFRQHLDSEQFQKANNINSPPR